MSGTSWQPSDFAADPVDCARRMVGAELHWRGCSGRIVETEAYAAVGDEACHTFSRPSSRAFVEDGRPGDAYVYLNYGMYWLLNFLVKGGGSDGFVLVRALEPLRGRAAMARRRGRDHPQDLCSGPGKLTIALGMDASLHGRPLARALRGACPPECVEASPRIGISRAVDRPWRFTLAGSPWVSGARRRRRADLG